MIETNSFLLHLPESWKVHDLGKRLEISTPNDGFIIVSSTCLSGDGLELNDILSRVEQNAIISMQETAKQSELVETFGPASQTLPNGAIYTMMASFTTGKSYFLIQYSIRGPRTVMIVTFEGPAAAGQEIDVVSKIFKEIEWL